MGCANDGTQCISKTMGTMAVPLSSMAPAQMVGTPSSHIRPASPANAAASAAAFQSHDLCSPNRSSQALEAGAGASSLSLGLPVSTAFTFPGSALNQHSSVVTPVPLSALAPPSESGSGLLKVKLTDILPEDGAPSVHYTRAIENLAASLTRVNAAVIELNAEDAALLRCALESAKLYFQTRGKTSTSSQTYAADWTKSPGYITTSKKDMYYYHAGRSLCGEDDIPPPCMSEVYRLLGRASRAALSAIARSLRLRGDVFCPLLDDSPLSTGEASSSVLTATLYHAPAPKGTYVEPPTAHEVEKGLLILIAADTPGLQICDTSGRWYLADSAVAPGDIVLLTGRALSQATASHRRPGSYRVLPLSSSTPGSSARTSLAFRLMPRINATIDCSPLVEAGYTVPEGYEPVTVAQFMDGLQAAEALVGNRCDNSQDTALTKSEPSLKSVLCDPITGSFLEDAVVGHCGHSFGGATLQRVLESRVCPLCGQGVEGNALIPNHALRAAATAYRREDYERPDQFGRIKRRKEPNDLGEMRVKRPPNKEDAGSQSVDKIAILRTFKGVQYPFDVDERVMIKGNKRTPEKFVGREAVVTSLCLNGWYLVRTLDTGESVRLQYRSLQKVANHCNGATDQVPSQQHMPVQHF